MRFNKPTVAAVLAGLVSNAAGQKSLPDDEVPEIGGGFFKGSDPAVADYTWDTKPPFTAADYGGYYTWAINNNTVSVNNATAQTSPMGITNFSDTNTKYPFFIVNEGSPKKIIPNRADVCQSDDESHGKGRDESHPKFKKILHVIFENEYYGWTMNDSYWKLLATRGKLLTNSHGITHPSFSNYAGIVAGDFFGINAENWYFINTTTIYDLLDAKGLDYATYAEWYTPVATKRGPNDCNNAIFMGPLDNTNPDWSSPVYRRLDVPPLLFSTYTSNYTRCSRIYNATEKFDDDVKSHRLPPYSFYVPDMLHNGHDPESDSDYAHQPTTAGIWFNAFLDMYLPELTAQGTLVVATWDEATWQNDSDSEPNNNNSVATLLFGHGITPNTTDDTYITHYGLLRGAIGNFGLGSLGRNDTNATNGDVSLLLK
jgi:hypothetical protein